MAIHDKCPEYGEEEIAEVLQGTMGYVDQFNAKANGDLNSFLHHVEDVTGLLITVDSKPKEEEE